MLTVAGSKQRLARLRAAMAAQRLDVAVLTHPKNVYYFSAHLPPPLTTAALVVTAATSTLVTGVLGGAPETTAADAVRTFGADAIGTIRPDQQELLAAAFGDLAATGTVGTEIGSCSVTLAQRFGAAPSDLTAAIAGMRRAKDPDEVELLRASARCIDACYAYARERIEPGLNELTLHGELYRVAEQTAGEPIERFGQDFRCGAAGGPPRDRAAEAGELWILDLGVGYRGYSADASRAFAVSATASAEQQEAWEHVRDALQCASEQLRPGLDTLQLYQAVKQRLDAVAADAFWHHLGHGIGLTVHEAPYFNPEWQQTLAVGDVVTLEPGFYQEPLRAGIRLENDFLITEQGAEQLTHAALELV